MGDKLETNIIDSVERVFRYIIPGVAFWFLFALSYPDTFNKVFNKISDSEITVFLLILSIGMSIYVIHSQIIRFTLEKIVYKFNISPVNIFSNEGTYLKALAKLLLLRENSPDYPKQYYIYLWSLVHYSLIMSELLILSSFCHEKVSWIGCNALLIGIAGAILLLLSLFSYKQLQVLEKNTTELLPR